MESTLNNRRIRKIAPVVTSVGLAILSGVCFTRLVDQYTLFGHVGLESFTFYLPMGVLALIGAVMLGIKIRRT